MHPHNLSISKFEESDFDNFFALVSHADVMKYVIGRPHTLDEAKEIFSKIVDNNTLHDRCGTFKVIDNNLEMFVGFVKLELETKLSAEAEIGYLFFPKYWGKGYGKQVAQYVINLAKDIPQLTKLTANIDPENEASRKILTNNGFISEKLYTWNNLPAEWLIKNI